ncbi:MAG TPA: LytTR family DNA-binding domain-containing protein, partial [Terriglobales bacterium]|nr:LytTR family DNA-binding domain-containing protein [Terriglobales bacterium]
IEIIGECADGESAVQLIRSKKPDLVFLDVQMPEMTGFEVIRMLGSRMPVTIFVTAYDRYALRAFDANAIDYLLKPFGKERFQRALIRARERIAGRADTNDIRCLLAGLEQGQPKHLERLSVVHNGRIVLVKVSDIDWIQACGNYAVLYVAERQYEIRETLTHLEERLDYRLFLRIHRSTMVNVNCIREIRPWFHGHHLVVLKSGVELRMSRYQREAARQLGIL